MEVINDLALLFILFDCSITYKLLYSSTWYLFNIFVYFMVTQQTSQSE